MVSHIVYTFSDCQEVVLSVFAHYYSCHSGVHIGPHLCLYFAPATPSPIGQFPANHCHSLAVFPIGQFPANHCHSPADFPIGQFPANHCHSPADFPIGQFPANHCHSPAVFVVGSLFVSDECRNTHLLLDLKEALTSFHLTPSLLERTHGLTTFPMLRLLSSKAQGCKYF